MILSELRLEISDYYVLLNLHKALIEAKFHLSPDNTYVSSSPIVADICNELVDLLSRMEIDRKGSSQWEQWRRIETQTFYRDRAIKNALLNKQWPKMDAEKKLACAKNLLSPFIATQTDLEAFVNEVDVAWGKKAL